MQTLHRSILYQILVKVELSTLLDVICTCKKLARILNDDLLWYCKMQQEYPNTKPETTWKQLYYKLAFDILCLFHYKDNPLHIAYGLMKLCSGNHKQEKESIHYVIDMFDRLWKYNVEYGVQCQLLDIRVRDFYFRPMATRTGVSQDKINN